MADKKCFVLSPIGDEDSEVRHRADFVLEYIISAALNDEYVVERADAHRGSDFVTSQIIVAIKSADLIVANLTDHNPNVFYELGIAHAFERPIVHMIRNGQKIPFDNAGIRTIFYSDASPRHLRQAADQLKQEAAAEVGKRASNPVTVAVGRLQLETSPDDRDHVIASLAKKMDGLSQDVERLTREGRAASSYDSVIQAALTRLREPSKDRSLAELLEERQLPLSKRKSIF